MKKLLVFILASALVPAATVMAREHHDKNDDSGQGTGQQTQQQPQQETQQPQQHPQQQPQQQQLPKQNWQGKNWDCLKNSYSGSWKRFTKNQSSDKRK